MLLLDRAEVRDEMPRLKVYIYRGDRMVRVEEIPDPRQRFVKEYNEVCKAEGFSARAG
jgi:hypothetical protein